MSVLKHRVEVCVTAVMRYLGSGPQELNPQFYIKAEMLSSPGTRSVIGILHVFPPHYGGWGVESGGSGGQGEVLSENTVETGGGDKRG